MRSKCGPASRGFNGAACRSTRRGWKRRSCTLPRCRLQRSRVPEHAERTLGVHPACSAIQLQRSRVPEHAESAGGMVLFGMERTASTEPRAGARGEVQIHPMFPCERARLQRSRVPEHAESRTQDADQVDVRRIASTEPRAGARGERRRRPWGHHRRKASTEPRAGARGETASRRAGMRRAATLQRSRVPEHAESKLVATPSIVDGDLLQRSRVPEHAESVQAVGPGQRDVVASTEPRAGARGEPACCACRPMRRTSLQRSRVPEHAESGR